MYGVRILRKRDPRQADHLALPAAQGIPAVNNYHVAHGTEPELHDSSFIALLPNRARVLLTTDHCKETRSENRLVN
jgi:hypothetical protein